MALAGRSARHELADVAFVVMTRSGNRQQYYAIHNAAIYRLPKHLHFRALDHQNAEAAFIASRGRIICGGRRPASAPISRRLAMISRGVVLADAIEMFAKSRPCVIPISAAKLRRC